MKKVLKVQVTMDGPVAKLKIIEQSHRNMNFGCYSNEFTHTDRIIIKSDQSPAWHEMPNRLYVQGEQSSMDNDIIKIETRYIFDILEAVKAYNEFEFPAEQKSILPDKFVKDFNKLLKEYGLVMAKKTEPIVHKLK